MSDSQIEDFGATCSDEACTPASPYKDGHKKTGSVEKDGIAIQWSRMGRIYRGVGTTEKKMPAGVYSIDVDDHGLIFVSQQIRSDEWLSFRDGLITQVVDEIAQFWNRTAEFKKYGFLQRRGYMMYGPPGTGKTVLVKQIIDKMVEDGGIVFMCDDSPALVASGLKAFSEIEKDRNIVCIYEDIDAIIDKYGESDLLALLDGEDSTDKVLNIATTNYPEKLDRRIVGRPRRFDRIIKIGYPDADMRRFYFTNKLQIDSSTDCEKWVSETENFTFAALTELVISVKCLGNGFSESVKRIRNLLQIKVSSTEYKVDSGEQSKLGFSR